MPVKNMTGTEGRSDGCLIHQPPHRQDRVTVVGQVTKTASPAGTLYLSRCSRTACLASVKRTEPFDALVARNPPAAEPPGTLRNTMANTNTRPASVPNQTTNRSHGNDVPTEQPNGYDPGRSDLAAPRW